MPVLPEVDSTIVLRPGSIRPSASAASIIATPILSFTLPAGLYASSLPISSAPQSGATLVSRTIGVLPRRSARLSGIARVGGETLTPPRVSRPVLAARPSFAEPDSGDADHRRPVRSRADAEHDPAAVRPPRGHHECQPERVVRVVLDLDARE